MDYYPLTLTSFWAEWQAWNTNPMGYHIVNVVLHVLSTLVLWRLLVSLRVPGAWVAAALFGLHPVNVESVAWISQQKNTLSSVFFFAALLAHQRFRHGRGPAWYGTGLALYALALLSKPSVVAFPLIVMGIEWWQRGRIGRRVFGEMIPHLVLSVVAILVTLSFQHQITEAGHVYEGSAISRLAVAGRAVWFYLYKALFPAQLSLVYPRWNVTDLSWVSYVPAALCLVTTLALWFLRRRARGLFFSWCCFLLLLAPVLGFIDIGYMQFSLVADHWQYFSLPVVLATLVAAVSHGFDRAHVTMASRAILVFALLTAALTLTWLQAETYESEEIAWRHTLRDNPAAWNAQARLGNALRKRGAINEAASHYLEAVRLNPTYAAGHQVLGTLFATMAMYKEAEAHFERAVELQPGAADAWANYGHYFIIRGRYQEAIEHLRTALTLEGDNPQTLSEMGMALQAQGELSAAEQYLDRALAHRKSPDDYFNLGLVCTALDKHVKAADAFTQVVRLKPQDVEARLLLSDQYVALGRKEAAIDVLHEARQLARGNPRLLDQIDERLQGLGTP
jgi:tetratricopeptide (TPR) repeat protein